MKRAEMDSGIPVKSLVRFRCVSRLLKNLINSPSFIIDHLSYSNRQTPSLITDFEGTSNLNSLDLDMDLRGLFDGHPTGSIGPDRIVGSCHGLLCVQTGQLHALRPTLSLWNPAIREVMQVPRSGTISGVSFWYSGFGFNPSVNDYHIVMIYTVADDLVIRVEVYSLATNSWKDIEFGILKGRSFYSESLNVNGSMFWLARNRLEFKEDEGWKINTLAIVSFDLALEEFKVIPAPALSGGVAKLAMCEERLALLYSSFAPNSSNYVIDLWVIEEGTNASWNKKFTFGPYPYHLRPLIICRNQIVGVASYIGMAQCMEEDWEKREKTNYIFLINITSNVFKVIADTKRGYSGRSFEYVESLLSPSNIQLGNP